MMQFCSTDFNQQIKDLHKSSLLDESFLLSLQARQAVLLYQDEPLQVFRNILPFLSVPLVSFSLHLNAKVDSKKKRTL